MTTEEEVNAKTSSNKARTLWVRKGESNTPTAPRKRAAGKSQSAPKRLKKTSQKKTSSKDPVGDQNWKAEKQILATESDEEYGFDEPFPELSALPDLAYGSNGSGSTIYGLPAGLTDIAPMAITHDTPYAESDLLVIGKKWDDECHNATSEGRHEWSESTVVTDIPWSFDSTPTTLPEQTNGCGNFSDDEYGDLDDDDLACLDDDNLAYLDISSDALAQTEQSFIGDVASSPENVFSASKSISASPCRSSGLPGASENIPSEKINDGGLKKFPKLYQKHDVLDQSVSSNSKTQPIVRSPFPLAIRDRSPLIGLSSSTILRTCFRIGEAINVGSRAIKENKNIVIEIYARVNSSHRDENSLKQHFQLINLYHDRPPYLNATYDLWKDNELWEKDSRTFLEQSNSKKLCRCIGRMKRDDQQKLVLILLNIWEVTSENVEYTRGIVCG
jgi:hypothetical protein